MTFVLLFSNVPSPSTLEDYYSAMVIKLNWLKRNAKRDGVVCIWEFKKGDNLAAIERFSQYGPRNTELTKRGFMAHDTFILTMKIPKKQGIM